MMSKFKMQLLFNHETFIFKHLELELQSICTKAPPVSFEHNNSLSASHVKLLLRKQNFDSVQFAQKVHPVV